MRSSPAALVPAARFLAKLLWIIAKVIISLIALFVFPILLSFLIGPLVDAIGLDDYWSDIGLGLFAAAYFAFIFVLFRWNFGKWFWIKPGGPWTDAHTLGLRRTVQEELSRHRRKKPYPHA